MKLYTELDLVELVQSLKDYTHESHSILGYDEREAREFVDIFLKDRKPIELPTDEIEKSEKPINQTKISDKEIEKASKYWNETTNPEMWTYKLAWKAGAKWYREQLKNKI